MESALFSPSPSPSPIPPPKNMDIYIQSKTVDMDTFICQNDP